VTLELEPGAAFEALTVALEHEPLDPELVVSGTPTVGVLVLDDRDGRELGVWEMSPGSATDVETDEVFVVLAGSATVDGIAEGSVSLCPGTVVRLTAGMRSTWTVHETLRKLYLI
jgi:uncharacterized cupin superfamily protein